MRGTLETGHIGDLVDRIFTQRLRHQPVTGAGEALAPQQVREGRVLGLQYMAQIAWRNTTILGDFILAQFRIGQVARDVGFDICKPLVHNTHAVRRSQVKVSNIVRQGFEEGID